MPAASRALRLGPALVVAFLLAAGVAISAEPEFPTLTGRVVDTADTLSPSVREALTQMLARQQAMTGQQIVVVTLKSLQGYTIEEYGYQLGRHWGIGQEGQNNGALLIVAPNERKVRIEVGYGLEDRLTDATSRIIIDQQMLPHFRQGDYSTGVLEGTAAILRALGGSQAAPGITSSRYQPGGVLQHALVFIVFLFPVSMVIFLLSVSRRQKQRYVSPGGDSGSSGGGYSSGGGSSGGESFSGGGGDFGGGGASDSW